MGEVVVLDGPTTLPIPVERVLNAPEAQALEHVLLLGWTKERKFYAASSHTKGNLELAARFQHKLMAGDYD